jgi:predicted exporter
VALLFGSVHGITLAFGFTLIGVAQDYPMHLFSPAPGAGPLANARALWPTLATGRREHVHAYLAFLTSGVAGLAQLACFTVAGLAVAGLSTRYALPRLMSAGRRDHGDSRFLARLWSAIESLPRPRWLGALLVEPAWPWWRWHRAVLGKQPRDAHAGAARAARARRRAAPGAGRAGRAPDAGARGSRPRGRAGASEA